MNTIIEKIRAEVNRQAKSIDTATGDFAEGRKMEQRIILSVLSDLEKEEKPMELDFEQELYNHFGQVKDFTLGMRIGQYFYELGCRRTAEKYDEIEYKRQRAEQRWLEDRDGCFWDGVNEGKKAMREQMMKEAVECEVTETCGISSVWIKTKQFKPGQKVKLIIVKED